MVHKTSSEINKIKNLTGAPKLGLFRSDLALPSNTYRLHVPADDHEHHTFHFNDLLLHVNCIVWLHLQGV